MESEYTPHEIIWTHEKSSRFWDYFTHNKAYEENFFSKQVGNAIIDFILTYTNLSGNILDYGCGHGHLIEKLLKRGIPCEGLDFSSDSVRLVEKNFCKEPHFKGVTLAKGLPTQLESGKFDVVFLIETIEHILTEDLDETLKEIYRITRKGGYVFVTTPNEENLEAAKVICPECGCIFHIVQHVRSWTKDSLSSFMENNGFTEVVCKAIRFRKDGKLAFLLNIMMNVVSKIIKKRNPHLIYIGKK